MIGLKDCKSFSSTNSFTVCWSCCVLCFVVPYISNFPSPPPLYMFVRSVYLRSISSKLSQPRWNRWRRWTGNWQCIVFNCGGYSWWNTQLEWMCRLPWSVLCDLHAAHECMYDEASCLCTCLIRVCHQCGLQVWTLRSSVLVISHFNFNMLELYNSSGALTIVPGWLHTHVPPFL